MATLKGAQERILPNAEEAEKLLLGAILLYESHLERVRSLVQTNDFYLETHRFIYGALVALASSDTPIDLVTIKDELRRREELDRVGVEYLASLTDGIPRVVAIEHYAKMIRETAERRLLIQLADTLKTQCLEPSVSIDEIRKQIRLIASGPSITSTIDWKLWDANEVKSWAVEPLEWDVEPLIPRRGVGFMSAAPKDGKSLLALDQAIHLAHAGGPYERLWLGKYKCRAANVLYIAREDTLGRVKGRIIEICGSYGLPVPPKNRLLVLPRERISLMDDLHRNWLMEEIRKGGFDFLVLDVLNRMIPGLDELSNMDMSKLVTILEDLNRTLGITIELIDHTKKPQGKNTDRNGQVPNPFDLKGGVAKYGAADFMVCMSRTHQVGRLEMYCENKDTDEKPRFFVDVSPKDSGKPKHTWAGDVEQMVSDMKKIGQENRKKVLEVMGPDWVTGEMVASTIGLSKSTVNDHLRALFDSGEIERGGKNRDTKWRRLTEQEKEAASVG